jgi:GT2 family glycosyltransferase
VKLHLNSSPVNIRLPVKLPPLPKDPLLSIVITSYSMERLRDLAELLDSIRSQAYQKIEVVYVVEGSKKLLNWLSMYVNKRRIPNVKLLFNDGKLGLAQARNLGIKNAEGEIIAFIDDDVLLPENWAEEMVKTYKLDKSIIGVTGPAEPLWEDGIIEWLPEELYWIISCSNWLGLNKISEVRSAQGMNMSFRREAFIFAGFFSDKTGFSKEVILRRSYLAEDLEFSIRLKFRIGLPIIYNPKVKVWHKIRQNKLSWKYIIERSIWIGRTRKDLKNLFEGKKEEFNVEFSVLRRIITKVPAKVLRRIVKKPKDGIKMFIVTMISLISTVLGYFLL